MPHPTSAELSASCNKALARKREALIARGKYLTATGNVNKGFKTTQQANKYLDDSLLTPNSTTPGTSIPQLLLEALDAEYEAIEAELNYLAQLLAALHTMDIGDSRKNSFKSVRKIFDYTQIGNTRIYEVPMGPGVPPQTPEHRFDKYKLKYAQQLYNLKQEYISNLFKIYEQDPAQLLADIKQLGFGNTTLSKKKDEVIREALVRAVEAGVIKVTVDTQSQTLSFTLRKGNESIAYSVDSFSPSQYLRIACAPVYNHAFSPALKHCKKLQEQHLRSDKEEYHLKADKLADFTFRVATAQTRQALRVLANELKDFEHTGLFSFFEKHISNMLTAAAKAFSHSVVTQPKLQDQAADPDLSPYAKIGASTSYAAAFAALECKLAVVAPPVAPFAKHAATGVPYAVVVGQPANVAVGQHGLTTKEAGQGVVMGFPVPLQLVGR